MKYLILVIGLAIVATADAADKNLTVQDDVIFDSKQLSSSANVTSGSDNGVQGYIGMTNSELCMVVGRVQGLPEDETLTIKALGTYDILGQLWTDAYLEKIDPIFGSDVVITGTGSPIVYFAEPILLPGGATRNYFTLSTSTSDTIEVDMGAIGQ